VTGTAEPAPSLARLEQRGEAVEAVHHFEEATRLDPDGATPIGLLGIARLRAGAYAAAFGTGPTVVPQDDGG
jgi:Flp pilus assembly protein TadD